MRLQIGYSSSDVNELKEFSDWILNVGDENIRENNDEEAEIEIPDDILIKNSGDPIASIVNSTYPSLLENMSDISFFQDRAILAPTNDIVDSLNNCILSMIPGEKKTYLSVDNPSTQDENINSHDKILTPEFLNTVKSSGLPNHELNLKVGVPNMLLRNIDQPKGLCNGTRLIITQMRNFVLEAKIISANNIGQKVYISRLTLSLSPFDTKLSFTFQRKQFPIVVSFVMTINKSQGQSLKNVGIYLPKPIFSHGQLYVTLSRVISRARLKLLICDDEGRLSNKTYNVVYKEVFQNLR